MRIAFTEQGFDDYRSWMTKGGLATIRKINALIDAAAREPFRGIGKPEPLRGQFAGAWSRRIDHEHRLVYLITGTGTDQTLIVLRCHGHYR